jgi:glucose-1-phosphate cytidylyltransferase
MKVVVLAGGYGTRLAEQTELKAKPMVEIGGYPILWHILKHYAHHQHNEFVIALGHRGDDIKRYFLERSSLSGDLIIELATQKLERQNATPDDWTVHLIETGSDTNTGGRVKRLEKLLGGETFMLTYGDAVSSVDLTALLRFHKSHGCLGTVTAVRPPARFGGLVFDGDMVAQFTEKSQIGEGWVNGGYLVLDPGVFRYLSNDSCSLERDGLERMACDKQLAAYRHDGFWQCMDTPREKRVLESLWQSGKVPWKVWEQE